MFEKNTRLRVKKLLEKEFGNFQLSQKILEEGGLTIKHPLVDVDSSSDERNMTRKTRSRQLRIHSAFQPGFCAVCHIPYNSLEDHIQSKRHLKLIGDDGSYISLKGFDDQDSLLSLDGLDEAIDVKNCDLSPYTTRNKMPKTRATSLCDRNTKDSPMSPVGSDSGHHLRSRKNINYMTPPLDEDSLTEKPEVVKEYRELRSSSRLLAKLADQITENEHVWNSGRPKRSCNRSKVSADDRLVVDNKNYYKVEVLTSKLRSGDNPFLLQQRNEVKQQQQPQIPIQDEKGFIVKIRKVRNSELMRLNNEAENFLFPKKDDTTSDEDNDEDDDDDNDENNSIKNKVDNNSLSNDSYTNNKRVKIEDDESMHSIFSERETKGKRKRRTHAEAFITDNQKYYKFETPGSRLRYHGSYLSPVSWKTKNNGDLVGNTDKEVVQKSNGLPNENNDDFKLSEFSFAFESIPKKEAWYKTFKRKDTGDEKYVYLDDSNYWNPIILPYQLAYIPPLDPKTCISTYNHIKRCLTESLSASTSVGCSTPDPNASNSSSSIESQYTQDEDSKISALTEASSTSTIDELKPLVRRRGRRPKRQKLLLASTGSGKNPRKSPRQHASTLAILSSLIQQRKRKASRRSEFKTLPTILEEPKQARSPKQQRKDYLSIARVLDMEIGNALDQDIDINIESNEGIDFKSKVDIVDLLRVYDNTNTRPNSGCRRLFGAKPGRKPGSKKKRKNRTGWPKNIRRVVARRECPKEEDLDDSTLESVSVTADSEFNDDICEDNTTDSNSKQQQQQQQQQPQQQNNKFDVKENSENNNKNDQSSLEECDFNDGESIEQFTNGDDSVLTNSVSIQYQPYVRVQKLDRNRILEHKVGDMRRTSPKRTNRGQRRMPASPKSPRMLRRPRGRWYRER